MKSLSVLLVDDMSSAKTEVSRALEKIGVEATIDYRCPDDPEIPFGCALPADDELNQYDLALVDLELFPPKSAIEYNSDDLRGGTEVLPYLRLNAPWLPVIGASRLFGTQAEHFLAIAGSFGFDGHIQRQLFSQSILTVICGTDLLNKQLIKGSLIQLDTNIMGVTLL